MSSSNQVKRAVTHKYEPSFKANEHNIYVEEYFSGPDVRIYLDGQEQYEISQLSFTIQEQIKPIYGYASRLYDEVAIGNRIVVGSFTVPLKNKKGNNLGSLKSSFNANYQSSSTNNYTRPGWVETLKNYDKNHGTISSNSIQNDTEYGKIKAQGHNQTFRYKAGQTAMTDDSLIDIGRQLVSLGYLSIREVGNAYTYTYYQAVRAFQKDHCPHSASDGILTPELLSAIQQVSPQKLSETQKARGGAPAGDTITQSSAKASSTVSENEKDSFFSTSNKTLLRRHGYSILVEIGDNEQYLKAIVDVRLRSKSISVDASGNPIAEVYEFIARDIRENTESTDTI